MENINKFTPCVFDKCTLDHAAMPTAEQSRPLSMQVVMPFGSKVFQAAGIIIIKVVISHHQVALSVITMLGLASLQSYSICEEKAQFISVVKLVFTVKVHTGGQTVGALPAVALLPFKDLPLTFPLRFAIRQPQTSTLAAPRGWEKI